MKNKYSKLIVLQISILLIVLLIGLFIKLGFTKYLPQCYWLTNYNFYCPSCGSTRCIISLFNFNLIEAFRNNPFLFILIIYLIIINLLYIFNTIFGTNYLHFLYPNKWWKIIGFFVIWIIYTILINILI